MRSPSQYFVDAVKDSVPMAVGILPFALMSGVAAVELGLTAAEGMGLAVFVFAGASQLAALQLMANQAPLVVILLTVAMVNVRFLMYSAAIAHHFQHLPLRWKGFMGYFLTDQAFAFSVLKFQQDPATLKRAYYLGVGVSLWMVWQLGTLAGIVLGRAIPHEWSLEFAIPLIFLGLLMPAVRDKPNAAAALTAAVVAVAAWQLPFNLGFVLAALTGIVAGLFAERGSQ